MKRVTAMISIGLLALGAAGCNQPNAGTAGADTGQARRSTTQAQKPADDARLAAVGEKVERPDSPGSDAALNDKVREALLSAPGLNAHGIDVAAVNGVVTLYGAVEEKSDSERVALLAMSVEGVRSVINNLVVVRGSRGS